MGVAEGDVGVEFWLNAIDLINVLGLLQILVQLTALLGCAATLFNELVEKALFIFFIFLITVSLLLLTIFTTFTFALSIITRISCLFRRD